MPSDMIAATVPLAMSAAAVLAGDRWRERRRRRTLNRALHELRRPLQALVLTAPDPVRVEPVIDALAELDSAINGSPHPFAREPVELRHVAEAVVQRWAQVGSSRAGGPSLRWRAGRARVLGDRAQLARALDNLVANAIEHGGGPIEMVGSLRRGRLRVMVRDGGGAGLPATSSRGSDPRRGHGLEIVRSVAAAHGGRFVMRQAPALTLAVLELPLAEPEPAPSRTAA